MYDLVEDTDADDTQRYSVCNRLLYWTALSGCCLKEGGRRICNDGPSRREQSVMVPLSKPLSLGVGVRAHEVQYYGLYSACCARRIKILTALGTPRGVKFRFLAVDEVEFAPHYQYRRCSARRS